MTFQLTPLLDLLLIVIFAQYMEVRDTSQDAMDQSRVEKKLAEDEKKLVLGKLDSVRQQIDLLKISSRQSQSRADEAQAEIERLHQVLNRKQQDTADQLKLLAEQRDIAVTLASRLFQLPPRILEDAMQKLMQAQPDRSEEEFAKIKKDLGRLSQATNREVLLYFLQFAELRRWCEIWELHLNETGVARFSAGDSSESFIVRDASIPVPQDAKAFEEDQRKTTVNMENKFYSFYKRQRQSLTQAKSVVIVFVTYNSETPYLFRKPVIAGLREATNKMHRDSAGNVRFEYAVLGVLESSLSNEEPANEKNKK